MRAAGGWCNMRATDAQRVKRTQAAYSRRNSAAKLVVSEFAARRNERALATKQTPRADVHAQTRQQSQTGHARRYGAAQISGCDDPACMDTQAPQCDDCEGASVGTHSLVSEVKLEPKLAGRVPFKTGMLAKTLHTRGQYGCAPNAEASSRTTPSACRFRRRCRRTCSSRPDLLLQPCSTRP